ncbi:MAG TPA: HNH endonuclease [Bacteroidia bacterium]|jgi:hypothetical protein|nr:HNH endonuclease [Bacteroidia bacterium]
MNCIFCKKTSANSKSIEHILPESLGNKEHYLQKGIVCDDCNNYFASKVEKPVLENPYFKSVRSRNFITSKKRRLVPDKVLFPHKEGGWADVCFDKNGFILEQKDKHIIDLISSGKLNRLIIPIIDKPAENDYEVSRFLAKVGLEFLAYKIKGDSYWIDELVSNEELNPIRNYARFGIGKFWKYSQRRIYGEEARFIDPIHHPEPYEILHEFDFLYTQEGIMYFIIVIMGMEFAINMAEPETEFYEKWLQENNGISPIRRFTERMVIDKP